MKVQLKSNLLLYSFHLNGYLESMIYTLLSLFFLLFYIIDKKA